MNDVSPSTTLAVPLPKPGRGADPLATLALGDLVVWRTHLSDLAAAAGRGRALPLQTGPAQTRLATGLRIRLRIEGGSALDTEHVICLDIAGHPRWEHRLSGLAIAELLDLVPDTATGRLLDGNRAPVATDGVTVVAFYLPQFHPFDLNDAAWGEGFTEWANVLAAKPRFSGHAMPLLPADLGFYDARLPDLRRRQGELAAEYGVDAFCYYFYWFSGRRVMPAVIDDILYSGQPALPFCLCWANEPWTRRWDGSEQDVIVPQEHDPAVDATLIADLLPFFADDRYIRVDGRPVLVIYRLALMNEPARVFAAWNEAARAHGFPGLFIVAARTFGLTDPSPANASVEFPPHGFRNEDVTPAEPVIPKTPGGAILDYRAAVVMGATPPPTEQLCFPGIMPRWDNTPRRGDNSHMYHGSTPGLFGLWAGMALARAAALPAGRRFVFINAWNEWGEGAALEPDRLHGRGYLEALRQTRSGYLLSAADDVRFRLVSALPPDGATRTLDAFAHTVSAARQILTRLHARRPSGFRPGVPEIIAGYQVIATAGAGTIDEAVPALESGRVVLQPEDTVHFTGWAMVERDAPHLPDRIAFLVLAGADNAIRYTLPIKTWAQRLDVRNAHSAGLSDEQSYFGFSLTAAVDAVAAGSYELQLVQLVGDRLLRLAFGLQLVRL